MPNVPLETQNISSDIQKLLDSGEYRLVELDGQGTPITYPAEVVMNRKGVLIAYTANCKKVDTL